MTVYHGAICDDFIVTKDGTDPDTRRINMQRQRLLFCQTVVLSNSGVVNFQIVGIGAIAQTH